MSPTTMFAAGTVLFASTLMFAVGVIAFQLEQLRRASSDPATIWKPKKLIGELTVFTLLVLSGATGAHILASRAFDHVIELETQIQKLEIELKHYKEVGEGGGQVAMSPPTNTDE